jgi:hypothetical protein
MNYQILNPNLTWANDEFRVWLDPDRVDGIALHHMAHPTADIQTIHQWHISRGWSGIGYNYWISKKGEVYRGRGTYMGAGILNHNDHLVHIGFQGDFENVDTAMSDEQFNAGIWLIGYLKGIFKNVKAVDGHKHWQPNACPGKNFPLEEMKYGQYRSATEKTSIFGQATATVAQMREYLKRKNPNAPDYAQLYLDIGEKYGITGDLAFCQSIKETGAWHFGGQVKPEQNNFAGLGATNGGAAGASFRTPEQGIEAQFQHLWGYATTDTLPAGIVLVDPRFDLLAQVGKRGSAPNWEDLNGKWAVPGDGYGQSILAMWKEMCSLQVQTDWKQEAVDWARSKGFLTSDHDPAEIIDMGTLCAVLKNMVEK